MTDAGRAIVVSDSRTPARDGFLSCRWSGYDESDGSVSVAAHLDAQGDRIRARFLTTIARIAAHPVRGRSLAAHFACGDGYNLFHMSLIAEKSPFKSARVMDALKLLALEEILAARRPSRVLVESLDAVVGDAVLGLCAGLGIPAARGATAPGPRRSVVRRLPHPLRALVHLAHHLRERWPLRRVRRGWQGGADAVGVFSYFFNIDAREYAAGRFHSPQWGPFPALLAELGLRSNWLHHLVPGAAVKDAGTAVRWLTTFNANEAAAQRHAMVDGELGIGVVLRAFANYLRCAWRAARLGDVSPAFTPPGSKASLWPLLRADWEAGTRGWPALQAALWIRLLDAAIGAMPRQPLGFYLHENQGWERALIHAWRRHGHGKLVAVTHSTVRFWDVRYFEDRSVLLGEPRDAPQPQPDAVAVNGPHARDMLERSGHTGAPLVDVEALRYLHLAAADGVATANRPDAVGSDAGSSEAGATLRLLVVGDSMREAAEELVRTLADALPRCGREVRVTFKPHPFTRIDLAKFALPAVESTEPMANLLAGADAVLGSISSAMVEGYCVGVEPIVFLGSDSVNFSPLVGVEGVRVARSAGELGAALKAARGGKAPAGRAYFHLDRGLTRWRGLLGRTTSTHHD